MLTTHKYIKTSCIKNVRAIMSLPKLETQRYCHRLIGFQIRHWNFKLIGCALQKYLYKIVVYTMCLKSLAKPYNFWIHKSAQIRSR